MSRPIPPSTPGVSPRPHIAQQDSLEIFPETSTIGAEQVQLLHEAEGAPSITPQDIPDINDSDVRRLPWWRRPSSLWIILLVPFTAIATSSTIAPRVEIYTLLVCQVVKPEYLPGATPSSIVSAGTGNAQCAADPTVQKAVAELQTVLAACQGILSCLTAGAWGLYSDRKGRTRVLGISIWGILINDFLFILVALCADSLPGNYWVLIIGPLIEGLLGGIPGSIAATHAYVADTTEPGTRSSAFSLALGLIFVGVAIGPTIGGLITRFTQQALTVFYMTTIVHFIYALMMWFVIPESLSKASMLRSFQKYHEAKPPIDTKKGPVYYAKKVVSFLSPLAVFVPVRRYSSQSKRSHLDFRLLMTVIAYGCSQILTGSYPFKFQYAAGAFGWTSETQGYWLSLVSGLRAIYLAVLLPFIIRIVKPIVSRSMGNSDGTLSLRTRTTFTFDLGLARTSLVFDIASYLLLAIFAEPTLFVIFSTISSLGAGFGPAVQALALDIYKQHGGTESGELFGAMSVVSALAAQVIGPFLFGSIYMSTVATFPRAIFLVSFGAMLLAFILMCFVRNYKAEKSDAEEVESASSEEDPLLG